MLKRLRAAKSLRGTLTKKQLVIAWIMGAVLTLEMIVMFKLCAGLGNQLVFAFVIAMFAALSIPRDTEGQNIFGLVRGLLKG